MRRWFRGQLAGHYVGRPRSDEGRALPHGQRGFSIDIYRAVVRDVVLLADEPEPSAVIDSPADGTATAGAEPLEQAAPTPVAETPAPKTHHHTPGGPALHQPHIAKVHFIDAHGPGRTVRAAALDVLASNVTFSHPASHNGKVYGRVEATVSGWYSPPAEAPAPRMTEAAPEAPGIVWESKEIASPASTPLGREMDAGQSGSAPQLPVSPLDDATAAAAMAQAALAGEASMPATASGQDVLRTSAPPLDGEPEKDPPLLAVAMVIAALLGLLAAPQSALIWLLCFLPPFGLRKWLLGVVPEGPATSFMAYAIGFGELLLAASTVAGYYSAGCRSLGVAALLGTIAAVMVSSVLPRAFGFAASLLGLAAILFAYYARLGLPYCG